jgi:hypothetical protein
MKKKLCELKSFVAVNVYVAVVNVKLLHVDKFAVNLCHLNQVNRFYIVSSLFLKIVAIQ